MRRLERRLLLDSRRKESSNTLKSEAAGSAKKPKCEDLSSNNEVFEVRRGLGATMRGLRREGTFSK